MKKFVIFTLSLILFLISGCWDRTELNEQAIWLATGWDITEDGEIEVSGQIIVPANINMQGEGTEDDTFFVISSRGHNVGEVLDDIQKKLPRKAFFGQRRVIIFSEAFAKSGLTHFFDNINRTPLHSLRGALFVIEGATAKEAIMQKNPLEKPSAFAILQQHRLIGGGSDRLYLHFLISAQLDGMRPSLPTIKITSPIGKTEADVPPPMSENILQISGAAIFNDELKMNGSLTNTDNKNLLWIIGILKKDFIVSEHDEGNASAQLYKITVALHKKIF